MYPSKTQPVNEDRAVIRAGRRVTCFGNNQTTSTQNTSGLQDINQQTQQQQQQTQQQQQQNASTTAQQYTPPSWLTAAAQQNVGNAQTLQNTGFVPYTGQYVAPFSGQQQSSFDLGNQIAGGVSPYAGSAGGLTYNAASAGPASVSPGTISGAMSPYMNQYVNLALAPQIAAMQGQQALQSQLMQGQATSAGAFGDPRANNLQAFQGYLNGLQQQGLVGSAYNAAFNTAIGAGAQDVSNNLAGQTTNANLYESALQRELGGANQLYGMGTGATNLQNTLGGQQTQASQAQLNALYNQYLMAQQYPFLTTQNLNSAIQGAHGAVPTETTGQTTGTTTGTGATAGTTTGTSTGTGINQGTTQTQAPNNAGYGLLGSLFGAAPGLIGSSPGTTNAAGQAVSGGSGLLGWLGAAEGAKLQEKKPVIVGERGPELFVPQGKGTVIPNHEVRKLADKYQKRSPQQVGFAMGGPVIPGVSGMPPSMAGPSTAGPNAAGQALQGAQQNINSAMPANPSAPMGPQGGFIPPNFQTGNAGMAMPTQMPQTGGRGIPPNVQALLASRGVTMPNAAAMQGGSPQARPMLPGGIPPAALPGMMMGAARARLPFNPAPNPAAVNTGSFPRLAAQLGGGY